MNRDRHGIAVIIIIIDIRKGRTHRHDMTWHDTGQPMIERAHVLCLQPIYASQEIKICTHALGIVLVQATPVVLRTAEVLE